MLGWIELWLRWGFDNYIFLEFINCYQHVLIWLSFIHFCSNRAVLLICLQICVFFSDLKVLKCLGHFGQLAAILDVNESILGLWSAYIKMFLFRKLWECSKTSGIHLPRCRKEPLPLFTFWCILWPFSLFFRIMSL